MIFKKRMLIGEKELRVKDLEASRDKALREDQITTAKADCTSLIAVRNEMDTILKDYMTLVEPHGYLVGAISLTELHRVIAANKAHLEHLQHWTKDIAKHAAEARAAHHAMGARRAAIESPGMASAVTEDVQVAKAALNLNNMR